MQVGGGFGRNVLRKIYVDVVASTKQINVSLIVLIAEQNVESETLHITEEDGNPLDNLYNNIMEVDACVAVKRNRSFWKWTI